MAEIIATILAPPITKLCKCSFSPLKRQISYIVHYKKKFEQLKKKVEELKQIRDGVQRRVTAAERNLEIIHKVVKAWLVDVEKETSTLNGVQDEDVNMINTKCWCSCDIGSRYNLGKKTARKMFILDELLNDGKGFIRDKISEPCLIGTNHMPTKNLNGFVSFDSREHLKNEVMAALQDEGTNLIVVNGMGGVGKTTLVNHVYEHIVKKEKNLFVDIVKTIISRNVDLIKIQNDIAEQLGFVDLKTKESESLRADLLSKRLMQNSTLVILDDLWSPIKFSDVGIPCGGSCKVIITTRRRDICTLFHNIKFINVQVLSESDSWHLFKTMNVGDDLKYTSEMEETARKIVKECRGLPIALVTLGRALRNKKKHVLDSALHDLETSNIRGIDEEMDGNVYSSIKLSYDYLGNEILKICFLLCCLFPEDHKIYIPDLMAYVVGDGMMFSNEDTLKQRMDRLHTIMDKLVDSCLLLSDYNKYEGGSYFWMHDVVRDVAINVASQEDHGFLVRAGIGLEGWTSNSGTAGKCLRRLSLMKNKISALPEDPPELPHLLSLSLYGNTCLKEIPNSFFEKMESLATLDLRYTGISFLPSSLELLKNLRTLYLNGCKFNQPSDISVIGKLKKLEILSLANCFLRGLPKEFRGLTNLRSLNLENLRFNFRDREVSFIIPQNVISSFSRLEYLNMNGRNIKLEVEGQRNGNNACLEEVASLSRLSCLALSLSNYVYEDEFEINVSPKHGSVKSLSIAFSNTTPVLDIRKDMYMRNQYEINVSPPICDSIKVLIQKVEKLELFICPGLKSVGQVFGVGFHCLKELEIIGCEEIEYLMSFAEADVPRSRENLLLETIKLFHCRLKAIFSGPIPVGFVDKLSTLDIYSCNDMVCIFDRNLGRRVPNLEILHVSHCFGLKDVFNLEIGISTTLEIEEGLSVVTIFSKLTRMRLSRLPNLEIIWKENNIPFRCFENLEEINVSFCDKLRYLFTQSMARNLKNLKELIIFHCDSMEALITSTEQMVYADENQNRSGHDLLIFPNLQLFKLKECENLKQLWDQKNFEKDVEDDDQLAGRASILDFPYLETLKVIRCENLESIHLTHKCTLKLKKIVGDSEEWFHQKMEWEDPDDKLLMQPLFLEIDTILKDKELNIMANECRCRTVAEMLGQYKSKNRMAPCELPYNEAL